MARDSLVIDILAGKNTLSTQLEKIMAQGKRLGTLQAKGFGKEISSQVNAFGKEVGKSSREMRAFNIGMTESIKKSEMMAQRFDMNILSWMFAGMMMQRLGLSIVRFMIPSMDKLNKLNTEGAKKVIGMSAAFEFLKISMFEALASTPMFANFVEWIIKGAIAVSEFAQTHPAIVAILTAVGLIAAGLGTFMIGISFIGQMGHILLLLGITKAGAVTGGGAIGGASKFLTLLRTIGTMVVAAKIGLDLMDYLAGESTFREFIDKLGTDLMFLGAISGKPWIIAIGVVFKLMDKADVIAAAGKNLMDKSVALMETGRVTLAGGGVFSKEELLGSMQLLLGTAGFAGGAAVGGIGTSLQYLDVGIEHFEVWAAKPAEKVVKIRYEVDEMPFGGRGQSFLPDENEQTSSITT